MKMCKRRKKEQTRKTKTVKMTNERKKKYKKMT